MRIHDNKMSTLLRQLFSKYLIITNTVTSGSLLGLGDVITQNLEIEYASRMGTPEQMFDTSRTGTEKPYSFFVLRPPFENF